MATNKVLQQFGTQLLFADHATDFDNGTPSLPTTVANTFNVGTPTEVQMNLSIIAAAAGWESAKTGSLADTGTAWPEFWRLGAVMESAATPADGGSFDFYWNGSTSATAGTGNSGVASGVDSSIVVTGSNLRQLTHIGSLFVLNQIINKDSDIGILKMPYLYGSLIIVNNTSVGMVGDADADECFAVLTPVNPDIQAAV